MEESSTYQAIVQKGRAIERSEAAIAMRQLILEMGENRFGASAGKQAREALEEIVNLDDLRNITKRILIAESWDELLASRAKRGRRKSGH
jgi:hypothetical protein